MYEKKINEIFSFLEDNKIQNTSKSVMNNKIYYQLSLYTKILLEYSKKTDSIHITIRGGKKMFDKTLIFNKELNNFFKHDFLHRNEIYIESNFEETIKEKILKYKNLNTKENYTISILILSFLLDFSNIYLKNQETYGKKIDDSEFELLIIDLKENDIHE